MFSEEFHADVFNLGTISGRTARHSDLLFGFFNDRDLFTFTLAAPGSLRVTLRPALGLGIGDIDLSVNGPQNGSSNNLSGAETVFLPFAPAGNYSATPFAFPSLLIGDIAYDLEIDIDQAGASMASARDLGQVVAAVSAQDFVGLAAPGDTTDFYRFKTIATGVFSATLTEDSGSTSDADLALIQDKNNNGTIDEFDTLATSSAAGIGKETISRTLDAGTYFARVSSTKLGTNYGLSLKSTPTDNAGNKPASAKNLERSSPPRSARAISSAARTTKTFSKSTWRFPARSDCSPRWIR